MKWFIDAAAKLKAKGVTQISVVSETLTTHEYESKTLAKAFEEITGIKVTHDIIQKATWSRSCRPRCSRASPSMTAGSPTPT